MSNTRLCCTWFNVTWLSIMTISMIYHTSVHIHGDVRCLPFIYSFDNENGKILPYRSIVIDTSTSSVLSHQKKHHMAMQCAIILYNIDASLTSPVHSYSYHSTKRSFGLWWQIYTPICFNTSPLDNRNICRMCFFLNIEMVCYDFCTLSKYVL